MLEFDLQLFNDDTAETSEVETSSEESTETSSEETSEQELPEGFEGLEEYKKDILKDISEMEKTQTQKETSSPSQVDEVAALKAQIDEYKKQFGELPKTQPQQQPQQQPKQTQQQIPQVKIPQLQLTPEVTSKIKTAINEEAKRISGLNEEDLNAIQEYGDEDDANYQRWQMANKIAEENVYSAIRQAQIQQANQQREFLQNHYAAVQSYNDFAQREMSSPEFEKIKNFAIGEYFDSLSPTAQNVIFSSYERIERQTASPAEVLLIQNFFANAKAAYTEKKNSVPRKTTQPKTMPKIDSLNGANGNLSGGISSRDLENLMNEDFDAFEKQFGKYFK